MAATRRWRIAGLIAGSVVLLAVCALAAFPWGMLRGTIERRASDQLGRPVTIASMERVDAFGFSPRVRLRGVGVPQAAWAGAGTLATLDDVTIGFGAWPLLLGRFRPTEIAVDGGRLTLRRAADGRTNWDGPEDAAEDDGANDLDLSAVAIRRLTIDYADARRDRALVATVTSDARGLRATGSGTVRGGAVRLTLTGAPMRPGRWPFAVALEGPLLGMRAQGSMARPLDTGDMQLKVTARAEDLRYLDAIVEAGLTGTQPVRRLAADVIHRDDRWVVTGLTTTIGRSDLTGRVTVDKSGERNVIEGEVRAGQLDFADFASDEALAKGAALIAREGRRIVPNTPIDLKSVRNTDGRLVFRADRVVSRAGISSIRSLRGTVAIDRQRMTVAPLAIGLAKSAIRGRVVVDQRGGAAVPTATFDLTLRDSSLGALASGAASIGGRADARVRLTGRGPTIRAAVGNSSGTIGLIARGGAVPAQVAAALGFDLGRAALGNGDDRTGLRCLGMGVRVRGGRGQVDPLVIDTARSQARGGGTLAFPGEALALRLTGAPKGKAVLRVSGAFTIGGTLSAPAIAITPETRSAGNILKSIGRAIAGGNGPKATDADCGALAARVLR